VGDPVIENLLVAVEPFVTTARSKAQAIAALQLLIQQGRFKFGSEQLGRELGVYEHQDAGLVQDSVIAAAIAAYAAGQGEVFAPASGGERPALGALGHGGVPQRLGPPGQMPGPGGGLRGGLPRPRRGL
jgi:hypothetical protein